jgi:4a-hydroxytetrahydrobiopterin dehydratase
MSDGETPAQFHAAAGVTDWRVTSWGPQACFRTGSLGDGTRLLPAIVAAADRFGVEPDVDLRPEAVVIRIPYRGGSRIPAGASEFAAAVSAEAGSLGFAPSLGLIQTVDIAVAQHTGVDTRPFWTAALGYQEQGADDAVDPLRRGPSLSFQPIPELPARRGRTHIDVSVPADRAEARVAAALAAGGRLVDDSRAPMWWTIASPDNHGIDVAAWTDTWS